GPDADLGHVEAPRLDQTEYVVDIAPDAVTERLVDPLPNRLVALGTCHHGAVSLGELYLVADHLGRIVRDPLEHPSRRSVDLACEDVFALQCPAQLVDVDRVHVRDPAEAG